MSQLKWGSAFTFPENGTWFNITRQEMKGQTGQRIGWRERWQIFGRFKEDSSAAFTTTLQGFETAVRTNYQDLIFYTDAGTTQSAHKLLNANTLNGTRIVGRHYPFTLPGLPQSTGAGVEYASWRSFEATVEAEVYDPESTLIVFHQTIRQLSGGGIDFEVVEALTGFPQTQQTAQFTAVIVEQVGMAVGLDSWPAPASPLFPGYLKPRPQQVEYGEPLNFGIVRNINYPTRWHYRFEAPPGAIAAVPPPIG